MDQRTDPRDHQRHESRELVPPQFGLDAERRQPLEPTDRLRRPVTVDEVERQDHRDEERSNDGQGGDDPGTGFADPLPEPEEQQHSPHREKDDE